MKKVLIIIMVGVLMIAVVGCGAKQEPRNGPKVGRIQESGRNQPIGKGTIPNRQQNPENQLARKVMDLIRLNNGTTVLTKEQAGRLTVIINDIKVQKTIDATYADNQTKAIEAILTAEQKKVFDTRLEMGRQRRVPENGNTQQGTPPQGNMGTPPQRDMQPPSQANVGGPGAPVMNGKGMRGQMDLKTVCDNVLEVLKAIK